ncbi:hypothetical protein Tco_0054170 [Tanacetum coccineum]
MRNFTSDVIDVLLTCLHSGDIVLQAGHLVATLGEVVSKQLSELGLVLWILVDIQLQSCELCPLAAADTTTHDFCFHNPMMSNVIDITEVITMYNSRLLKKQERIQAVRRPTMAATTIRMWLPRQDTGIDTPWSERI